MLAAEQKPLSAHFAGRPMTTESPAFEDAAGVPLVAGALAHIAAEVVDRHPAGDHTLFIGEVSHLEQRDGQPLIFHGGAYRALVPELRWWDTWYRESGWL